MASNGLGFVLVLLVVQKCAVYVQGQITKSSLTFVIDDTQSMWDEISQVKEEVNIIFEKVLSSKASQIENFIIVTFNDPGAELRTITKDRNEFKSALARIKVHSLPTNTHCPEEAMTGIELGLTSSLPLSYIYVFTDAKARDYHKFKQIKSISQKKQSQVVFLLTGDCGRPSGPDYEVYHQVAQATGGQVFHILKDDVKDILKYIEESITGRGVSIVNKKYPPGTHKVKFTVDAHTGDVLISLTGLGSRIGDVTGPGGIKPPAEPIVSGKKKMAVKRLRNLKPGDYEVEIEGKGEVHIIMFAKSDINFQLGFSIDSPATLKDTVTRPPPEGNTFLGVRLLGEGVALTSVRISDLDNNIIEELPLTIVDKKEQFYITPSFHPPSTMFLVTVIGKDLKTGTPVIRSGPTPIARQDPTAEPAMNKAPEVTIQGAPKIIAEHDGTLTLKCNVHCYPAPNIIWSEKETGIVLPTKVQTVEVPYDFASSLEIKPTNLNITYECKASNSIGVTSKYVQVDRKPYFDVIEAPKDISVEYSKEGSIVCKIDAYPPATVTWYKDGAEFVGNTNVDLSGDKSTLTIKSMQPELKGKYSCEARSDIDRKVFIVDVDIFGVEKPVIDKSHGELRAPEMTNTELSCRTLKGIPKPTISWSFRPVGSTSFSEMTETTETVQLKEVRQDQTGTYQCSAKNDLGSDSFTMELIVEYSPTIKVDEKTKQIKNGEKVRIPCDVTGEPTPTVQWFFKGILLTSSSKILISSDHSIEFTATPSDIGDYTCEAKNKLDTAKITVSLDVLEFPVIDKTTKENRVTEKTDSALSCRILRGNPKPSILWSFKPVGTATFKEMTETTETVQLKEVRQDQTGTYQCSAKNALGSDSFTMELIVEYPPTIKVDEKTKQIKNGEKVRIPCDVTGEPTPTVQWFFKGILLTSSSKILISSDHSIEFTATPSDIGDYTCEAKNKLDTAKITVSLDVLEVPVIDKSTKEKRVREKTNTALSCRILRGNPKPSIVWSFKPVGTATFKEMKDTTKIVQLKKVRKDQTGTYECRAKNTQGSDSYTIELIVEYPPEIKKDVKVKQVEDDDEVTISCDVTGEPAPTVIWFFNGTRFDSAMRSRETSDHSLRFKARIADIGSYRCEATNKFGTAKQTTKLDVYVPVTIEAPKNSKIEKMVGKSHILECRADGYPKPNIKWSFQSSDSKIPAKDITPTGDAASLVLKNLQLIQQGLYTCEAENGIGGSDSITYDVKVYAPPAIVNKYPFKNFEIVTGDVAFRIQCNTTGSPKPSVLWMKNGLNVAAGSDWYDIEDDGTLIIKKIDRAAEGTYVCRAENILGHVTELYEVTVREYSVPLTPTFTIHVKEGETVKIDCGQPHSKTDQMRWYKDSLVVASGELTLYSVTRSDDGLYTCRVSNPAKSRSVTTKVVVGFKPEFSTLEPDTVAFFYGADAVFLSCEAIGQPKPTTAIWKHNGNILSFTDMSYPLGMVYGATGMYECEVSNAFGSIRRSFKVTSRDCILDIKEDFPKKKQPLMISRAFTWPVFTVTDGYMIIPHADYFYMNCPSKFSNPVLPPYTFTAFCEGDNKIKINGNLYNFADIQCNEEAQPQVSKTGIACLPGNTEIVNIGYKIFDSFLQVFDVCLDKDNNVPLFTKHKLSPDHTDRSTEAPWSNIQLPQDFNSLYDCSRQMYDITSTLGRVLSTHDSCCFGKRQLVNSHDLAPGIPPSTTFDYLNVIPHWSTCSSKNWEDVEQSVRKFAKSTRRSLVVSTGTATPLHGVASTVITLHDSRGGLQAVAPYLWKVVQDPVLGASLAIIQINIPELTPAEVSKHVLCPDICEAGITWINPANWQTIEDGYTYCCSIIEFEKAFGYSGRFSPDMVHVLFDGSLMPSSYLP